MLSIAALLKWRMVEHEHCPFLNGIYCSSFILKGEKLRVYTSWLVSVLLGGTIKLYKLFCFPDTRATLNCPSNCPSGPHGQLVTSQEMGDP
jgi:hypothetical protein